MVTVEELIRATIVREGSAYTNNPADYGGPTKYGITQATLAGFRGRPVTAADVAALERDEAERVYRKVYYEDTGVAGWPASAQALGFDLYVQHRPKTVGRLVQQVLVTAGWALMVDGKIGPKTIAAMAEADEAMGALFCDAICDERAAYYLYLIDRDPAQAQFRDGWLWRAAEFRSTKPDWLPARWNSRWAKERGTIALPAPAPTTHAIHVPASKPLPAELTPPPLPPPVVVPQSAWQQIAAAIVSLVAALATALGISTAEQSHPPAHELPAQLQLDER